MPAIPPPPEIKAPEGWEFAPPSKPEREIPPPVHGARRVRALLEELARRNFEALKIYQAFGEAQRFHQSQAKTRLLIGSNRSGKTNASTADMAMMLTGTHPWGWWPKENGRCYVVGWDQEFLGKVLLPKLILPGAFRILRDEHTGQWRPVVPDQEYDAANKEKWRDAPPFLPERFIKGGFKGINWESKKDFVARDIPLINGWVVTYYSSKGEPQRGSEIDDARISEEIENKTWPRELQRGLVKRGGRLTYEATPQSSSPWLYETYRKAHAPDADKRLIEVFHLHVKDNKYISQQDRQDFYDQLLTDHDRRVCWDGEFALGEAVVYPEFTRERHVIPSRPIPDDWNRWMVVDPGVTVCAVGFWAVPPTRNEHGEPTKNWHERHKYEELYIKRCSARIFAKAVKSKMGRFASGGFVGFVIDGRMGRQSQMGSGQTVEYEYAEALKDEGVYSRTTGSGFIRGSDDIKAREEALRGWLSPPFSDEPTAVLRVHDCCRMTIWEFAQQFYKQDPSGLILDQRVDKNNHSISTDEYFAELNPQYMVVPGPREVENAVEKALKLKLARTKKAGGGVSLGPPS